MTVLQLASVALAAASFLLGLVATLWLAVRFVGRGEAARERFTVAETMSLLGLPAVGVVWGLGVVVQSSSDVLGPAWLRYVILVGIPGALGLLLGITLGVRASRRSGRPPVE